jgi:hypothetical protein
MAGFLDSMLHIATGENVIVHLCPFVEPEYFGIE